MFNHTIGGGGKCFRTFFQKSSEEPLNFRTVRADISFERQRALFGTAPPRRKDLLVIDQDLLVRSVTEATSEVFSMMLDMEVRFTGAVSDTATSNTGLISIVGITGEWSGSGVFCCSPSLAGLICARMLGTAVSETPGSVDEEVLDVVAEVTNMMIGNVKNGLEPITGPLAISVPTVIHGRNFQFRNAQGLRGATLSFEAEGESFEVRIGLAPGSAQSARAKTPVFGLANV